MSSFSALESSTEGSKPIELYTFTYGSETFRYTSYAADVTVGANTWTATSIQRTNTGQGKEERRKNVLITVPATNSFAQQFIGVIPGQRASVSILRLQTDEVPTFDTQILVYKGQVSSLKFNEDGQSVQIVLRSIEAATSRVIPRFTFMGMCNHVLFDERCGVSTAGSSGGNAFSITGACSSISDNTIEVVGADSVPDGWWTGGYVKPNAVSDFRLVVAHTGTTLTLLMPFASDPTGVNMNLFAGCDHLVSGHCANKFDNVLEFGGFPFVPTKNPFSTGLD